MKRILTIMLCLILVICLSAAAVATLPKIADEADLLTVAQRQVLEEKAKNLAEQYGLDVIIVTVPALDGHSVEAYADDYYDKNGYGFGDEASGVLLLLAMETREWAISTCGEGRYALTDYGTESVFSEITEYLSNDEYYTAFDAYLDALEPYFDAYVQGDPIDGYIWEYDGSGSYEPGTREETIYYSPARRKVTFGDILLRLFVALILGAAAGGITLVVMRGKMNTARHQTGANPYIKDDSCQLTSRQDIFLYSHTSRIRRADDSNHGSGRHKGGGSSIHRSSGGRNHGGSHGRF